MKLSKLILFLFFGLIVLSRFYNFAEIQFDSDFGRDSLFAYRIIHDEPTLLGAQASVGGFFLGPLYFYAIAFIFLIFGPMPEMIMVFFAMLNIFAALIGWHLLSKNINTNAGLIFLVLFAFSPLLVGASRGATHMPMLPIITVSVVAMLVKAIRSQKLWMHFFSGIVLGLYLHVHFSAFLIFPGYFLCALVFTRVNLISRFKIFFAHLLGLFLMASPLILFDVRHGFITSKAFFNYIFATVQGGAIRDSFPHWTLWQKVTTLLSFIAPQDWIKLIILIGLGLAAQSLIRHRRENITLSVLGTLVLSMLAMLLLYRGYLFSYYLIVPGTLFLLFVSALLSRLRSHIGLILAILAALGSLGTLSYHYLPQYRTISNLTTVISVIKQAQSQKSEVPFAVFKDSADGLTGLAYEYRFLLTRDGFVPVSEYAYEQAEILYLIREDGDNDPLKLGNHEIKQFSPKTSSLIGKLVMDGKKIEVFELRK